LIEGEVHGTANIRKLAKDHESYDSAAKGHLEDPAIFKLPLCLIIDITSDSCDL
jgi:hypothetical protein